MRWTSSCPDEGIILPVLWVVQQLPSRTIPTRLLCFTAADKFVVARSYPILGWLLLHTVSTTTPRMRMFVSYMIDSVGRQYISYHLTADHSRRKFIPIVRWINPRGILLPYSRKLQPGRLSQRCGHDPCSDSVQWCGARYSADNRRMDRRNGSHSHRLGRERGRSDAGQSVPSVASRGGPHHV